MRYRPSGFPLFTAKPNKTVSPQGPPTPSRFERIGKMRSAAEVIRLRTETYRRIGYQTSSLFPLGCCNGDNYTKKHYGLVEQIRTWVETRTACKQVAWGLCALRSRPGSTGKNHLGKRYLYGCDWGKEGKAHAIGPGCECNNITRM